MRKSIFILWALLCLAITTTMPAAEGDAKLPEAANVEGAENDNQPEDTAADGEAHSEERRKSAWLYLAYLPCLIPILIIAGIIYAINDGSNIHSPSSFVLGTFCSSFQLSWVHICINYP